MQHDVVGLRDFYHRPLGGIVRRLLTQRIRARWRSARGRQVVGLGFAVPYIGAFREEAETLAALMPAHQGALVWPGFPYEFALANLAGTFTVEARDGQFSKIQPGAGKILGLLSLQALPRRATFDFSDVFSEGFAFERIHGDVKIARGVMLTNNFEISGGAAFVSLSGELSLPEETQNLTMRVVPEIGEGVALAAAVVGTPVLGLSTLLVSKRLVRSS